MSLRPAVATILVAVVASLIVGCSKSGDGPSSSASTSDPASPVGTAHTTGAPAATATANAASTPSTGGCAPGHVLSALVTGPRCMKTCAKTSDCPKQFDCASAPLSGVKGKNAKVCFDENEN